MGKRGKGRQQNSATLVKTKPAPQANPAVLNQMAQQYGQVAYSPNVPLIPYPGLQPKDGPRIWQYPIATNLNLVTRDNLTPFEVLRQLADLYDVIRLCKQSWFDCAANLEPDIVPVDGLLGKNEDASKYDGEIAGYKDFFESPDKQHSIHEWMNAALDDLSTIDAVAIYPRVTYGGDLYALDLIAGDTIKPLLDERGRTPDPPFYAYEQVVYGAPSGLYTTDEMLYLKEHHRTNSAFGFSRVENILMRVNQALRKQSLDMAKFTDGTIPAGFVSPAADLGWTPDQLNAFQTILDTLYAGNDALRARLKMFPPGSTFIPTNPVEIMTEFDLFLLKVACASFGTTPAEIGFTDDVNRATGETQEDVLYRRTLRPIAKRFERLFTYILKKFFNEKRFIFQWKGYEAADDFGALTTAHVALVQAGIESIPEANRALKLSYDGPNIPRFVMTKSGPFVVDDLANKELRDMQQQAQMAGLQLATTQQDDNGSSSGQVASGKEDVKQEEPESSPSDKQESKQEDGEQSDEKEVERLARADLRKWRDMAVSRVQAGKSLRPFISEHIPTGAFRRIEGALGECSTADAIKAVFERSQLAYGDAWWQNADPDIQKKLAHLQEQGVQHTRWNGTSLACDNCQQNIGQVRRLGEPFPSGAILAPAHGNCDCSNEIVSIEEQAE